MRKFFVIFCVSTFCINPLFAFAAGPPVNTVPAAKTVAEDTPLAVTGISVTDPDSDLKTVQLKVTTKGILSVTLSGGSKIDAGKNGSSKLTLSGTETEINKTLATLSYQGIKDFAGPDTLTVESTDDNSPTPFKDIDTVNITVTPVDNDAPQNNVASEQKVRKKIQEELIGVSVIDVDNNLDTVQLTVTKGKLTVTEVGKAHIFLGANGSNAITLKGTQGDINGTLATLKYQGEENARLTVMSTDTTNRADVSTMAIIIKTDVAGCDWNGVVSAPFGGDLWNGTMSVGPVASYSLVRYNLADKKSSLNATALGAGVSFRKYSSNDLAWFGENKLGRKRGKVANKGFLGFGKTYKSVGQKTKYAQETTIGDIPTGCRATTTDAWELSTQKLRALWSLSPTMYVFQEANADNLGVQFALNLGIWNDIFNIGIGWNLSGQNAGEWFILAGPSFGFRF